MTTADSIAAALRPLAPGGALKQAEVPLINQLAALWDARSALTPPTTVEPPWLKVARSYIGMREVKGPDHNTVLVKWWVKLGAPWFRDDETAWCGEFVAACLMEAGLTWPKNFAAALSYRDYGSASPAQLGAIGVKQRVGGGHVFFIVGETPDKAFYKALGGNQGDMVSIMDVRKADVVAIRWPAGVALPAIRFLPTLPAGTISTKED